MKMIRCAVVFLAVCGMCVASAVDAADLPAYNGKTIAKAVKKTAKLKKIPSKVARVAVVQIPARKIVPLSRSVAIEPDGGEINLIWTLDPLVANSDGAKHEDSASEETNLVVTEPGTVSQPYMIIELTGHVVKTMRTTARIDIQIGKTHRIVSWKSDDIQSGKFRILLNEAMPEGQLPDYIPVSALAFVTKEGKEGAAMVSLEKVVVRVGKVRLAGEPKDPATSVTGSISAN